MLHAIHNATRENTAAGFTKAFVLSEGTNDQRYTPHFFRRLEMKALKSQLTLGTTLLVALTALAGQASAGTIVADDPTAVSGAPAVGDPTKAAVGSGSWQAGGVAKTSIYMTPEYLFGTGASFTVDEITSMSWQTNKTTTGGTSDWYLTIYTTPDSVDDDAGWYGRRLTFEGLYANGFSDPADTWNTYQTGVGTNQVTAYDGNRDGNIGFYGAPTLADLQSGAIDWDQVANSGVVSSDPIDYGTEEVLYVVLETASGWAAGFTGNIDAFEISVGGSVSDTTLVDFEPVPEPATLALLGLGGLCLIGRRRRHQA